MTTGVKPYPYSNFRFRVEIAGITIAQVSEITGLQAETETEPYEEGGVNDFVHQLPKRTKYQHITLKRGITDLDEMWKWYQEVVEGSFKRKNGSIILMDSAGNDKWLWNFTSAYPVKWTGPDLKADSNTVAFETIVLAHNGIKKG
ncbi:MAG TPA: phage tail protein [Candidatus Limnocylindrales bacterium]|nr:phage tail protein [Candidatus Limnocylindrales bacterium]